MAPHKTSDGRSVPPLLGARPRTMSLIAAVLEDEARREAPARKRRRAQALGRAGLRLAAGLGCVLAAVGGGVLAWSMQTPELDRFETCVASGDLDAIEDALPEAHGDSSRARAVWAHARAQQAVRGLAAPDEVAVALRDAPAEDAHVDAAASLLAATGGERSQDPWAAGVAAGGSLDLADVRSAIEALAAASGRPAGASRTLAALQFVRGDVSAALATLDAADTDAARADLAVYEALLRPGGAVPPTDVPGRAALLQAHAAVVRGDAAAELLAQARARMLRWDPVAITTALRLSVLAADARGLRAWAEDDTFSAPVRELAAAHAHAVVGRWPQAEAALREHDPNAPWVAYVLGYGAAHRRAWSDALHLAATARRGMPQRPELEVLCAWSSAHLLDASTAHQRLVALGEQAPWAPRVWTATAEAAEANGRPLSEVIAHYERALELEHRPASAAAALAAYAEGEEAIHLWTMATELEPSQPRYRLGLGRAQLQRGRLGEAWHSLEPVADEAGLSVVELALAGTGELDARVEGWLERAAAQGVDDARLSRLRLRVRMAKGEDVVEPALALARQHPADGAAAALAVQALGRAQRLGPARRLERLARRRLPRRRSAQVTLALADALREAEEIREAAQLAYKGWSALPSSSPPLRTLSAGREAVEIWLQLGNTSGARAIARELTVRLPGSPDAWLLRAQAQAAADAPDDACRSFGRARTLDPNVELPGLDCGRHGS